MEFEFESLDKETKQLFTELKIEKSNDNVNIFINYFKSKVKKMANDIIQNIKEEYIEV